MAIIIPPKFSVGKPQLGTSINWSHPVARGLIGCWHMSEAGGDAAYDLGRYGTASLINNPTWSPGDLGIAMQCNSASSGYLEATHNPAYPAAVNSLFSIQCKFRIASFRNYDGLLSKTTSNIPGPFDSYVDSTGSLKFVFGNGSTSGILPFSISAGTWYDFVGITNPDSTGSIYINGRLAFTDAGVTSAVADGTGNIRIGNRNDDATKSDALISYCRVWNRRLFSEEISALYAEPFCFMQPQAPQRSYWTSTATDSKILTSNIIRPRLFSPGIAR